MLNIFSLTMVYAAENDQVLSHKFESRLSLLDCYKQAYREFSTQIIEWSGSQDKHNVCSRSYKDVVSQWWSSLDSRYIMEYRDDDYFPYHGSYLNQANELMRSACNYLDEDLMQKPVPSTGASRLKANIKDFLEEVKRGD